MAALSLKLASDRASVDQAVSKLQFFARQHADSWQINLVMPMIAQVQMDNREYKEAEKTFKRWPRWRSFPPKSATEAELMVVTVAVRDGEHRGGQQEARRSRKKAGQHTGLQVARQDGPGRGARRLEAIRQGHPDTPRDILKTTTDKATEAAAHNTLGETLFKQGNYTEARWEFLWVDTIYNQDRNQHAKALYFSGKPSSSSIRPSGQECRETLLNDRQFTGTEYQKMALSQK